MALSAKDIEAQLVQAVSGQSQTKSTASSHTGKTSGGHIIGARAATIAPLDALFGPDTSSTPSRSNSRAGRQQKKPLHNEFKELNGQTATHKKVLKESQKGRRDVPSQAKAGQESSGQRLTNPKKIPIKSESSMPHHTQTDNVSENELQSTQTHLPQRTAAKVNQYNVAKMLRIGNTVQTTLTECSKRVNSKRSSFDKVLLQPVHGAPTLLPDDFMRIEFGIESQTGMVPFRVVNDGHRQAPLESHVRSAAYKPPRDMKSMEEEFERERQRLREQNKAERLARRKALGLGDEEDETEPHETPAATEDTSPNDENGAEDDHYVNSDDVLAAVQARFHALASSPTPDSDDHDATTADSFDPRRLFSDDKTDNCFDMNELSSLFAGKLQSAFGEQPTKQFESAAVDDLKVNWDNFGAETDPQTSDLFSDTDALFARLSGKDNDSTQARQSKAEMSHTHRMDASSHSVMPNHTPQSLGKQGHAKSTVSTKSGQQISRHTARLVSLLRNRASGQQRQKNPTTRVASEIPNTYSSTTDYPVQYDHMNARIPSSVLPGSYSNVNNRNLMQPNVEHEPSSILLEPRRTVPEPTGQGAAQYNQSSQSNPATIDAIQKLLSTPTKQQRSVSSNVTPRTQTPGSASRTRMVPSSVLRSKRATRPSNA